MKTDHTTGIVITGMAAAFQEGPLQRLTGTAPFNPADSTISNKLKRYCPKSALWAAEAGERAMTMAGIEPGDPGFRWGIYTGQNGYQHPDFTDLIPALPEGSAGRQDLFRLLWNSSRINPFLVTHSLSNNLLGILSIHWGIQGDCAAFIRDETGVHASLDEAIFSLSSGICDVALVINGGTRSDWVNRDFSGSATEPLTPSDPFCGGACALVLENREHAARRSAPVHAELNHLTGRYLYPDHPVPPVLPGLDHGDVGMFLFSYDSEAVSSDRLINQVIESTRPEQCIDVPSFQPHTGCEGLALNIFVASRLNPGGPASAPGSKPMNILVLTHGKSGFTSAAFIKGWKVS